MTHQDHIDAGCPDLRGKPERFICHAGCKLRIATEPTSFICPKCGGDNAYIGASEVEAKTLHDAWCPDGSGRGFEEMARRMSDGRTDI